MIDRHELTTWMRTYVADLLGVPADHVDPRLTFTDLGLSSIQGAQLTGDLGAHLDMDVEPTVVYEFATIDLLAQELAAR